MDHPFEYRAHFHPETGLICHCPWGNPLHPDREREHVGSIKEASKLDWLKERPDFQPDHKNYARNKHFLDFLTKEKGVSGAFNENEPGLAHEGTDKVIPWLHREFKKGRLLPAWTIGSGDETHSAMSGGPHLQYTKDGSPWYPDETIHDPKNLDAISETGMKKRDRVGISALPEEENGAPLASHGFDQRRHGRLDRGRLALIQNALEDMSKRGKGIDIMQHKVHELMPKVEDWKKAKEAAERDHLGEVVHKFPDGWTIRQLQNLEEMEQEGQEMGHCIGTPEHGCPARHENGESVFASLRDPHNFPHATIELSPHQHERIEAEPKPGWEQDRLPSIPRVGPTSESHQFYGKEDSAPLPEYEERVNDWLESHGAHAVIGGGSGPEGEEAGWASIEAPYDLESYNDIHRNGDWPSYVAETDGGHDIGEMTEPDYQDPDWDQIAEHYLTGVPKSETPKGPFQPNQEQIHMDPEPQEQLLRGPSENQRSHFIDELSNNDQHREDFENALYEAHYGWEPDPRESKIYHEYHERMGQSLQEREERQRKLEKDYPATYPHNPEQSMLLENSMALQWKDKVEHSRIRQEENPQWTKWMTDNDWPRTPDGEIGKSEMPNRYLQLQGPEPGPWRYMASSTTRPLYYRWVYSPSKGVTLGSNQDDHPALVKYHQALGGDINDTDLVHGYASALDGGWRVSDLEHQPVEDPYIVQQVVRRLNHEDGPENVSHEGSWAPSEFDWDRLHYGIPCEKFVR